MCTLREFDMRSRGVVNLADEWKLHHAAVRKVWNVEDVIETTNGAIEMARELYNHFRAHGAFPQHDGGAKPPGNFGYFIHLLRNLLEVAEEFDDRASTLETQGYQVKGVAALRSGLELLETIISEDSLATTAAFSCRALDDPE